MLTAELTRKIDLLPRESYIKVENFVEQLIALNQQTEKESAFRTGDRLRYGEHGQ